jgi:hypothetical protein
MPITGSRVQYVFNSLSDAKASGWTENFYISGAGAQNALQSASSIAMLTARLSILGQDYALREVNTVNVANRADQGHLTLVLAQGQGQFATMPNEPFSSEQPWDAVLCRLQVLRGSVRMFSLRGVPTGVFKDTMAVGPGQSNGAWVNNFNRWGNQIAAVGFAIRGLLYPASVVLALPPSVVGRSISFVVPNPAPAWLKRRALADPIPTGLIRVRGETGTNEINGTWRVQDISVGPASTQIFCYPKRRTIKGIPAGVVAVDQQDWAFAGVIGVVSAIRASKRNTGRPPNLLRGRRSAPRT